MSLAYPDGYTPRLEPHCGVLSVAMCAGVTFETAWATLESVIIRKTRGGWKGATTGAERVAALTILGVPHVTRRHVPASRFQRLPPDYVEENRLAPGCTVAGFAARHAKPGVTYMIPVSGHVVTLRDGLVADQCGIAPAAKSHIGKRRVTHSTTIGETE